jgi:predicted enzyme related to lactoylglutathione lyase/predicted DNA-binding protein
MAPDKKQQFNIYLPPELIREVKHASVDTGGSLSDYVTEALEAYIHGQRASEQAEISRRARRLTPLTIVYVRDVARALPFYQALGFEIALRERTGDWVQLRMGDAVLGLHKGEEASQRERGMKGVIQFSLIVHDRLENLLERLDAAGFSTSHPIIDESFGRSVQLEAPEGLLIQADELEIDLYI